ncbi:proteoglycan 4 isoform X2 [Perca flavescens]|uniref:proteoglycan 4 isoform X2 n=1 Tax=Perca flavescens TaxID=8167 RepID=UPI00106E6B14|nr:proteoglycan 4-like isoform X2 [Perca flavescens]
MRTNSNEDRNPSESHRRNSGSSSQSKILDIERAETAEFFAGLQRAERLYFGQKSLIDEAMKRMGIPIQQDTLPSTQSPVSPTKRPESSLRGRRTTAILKDDKRVRTSRANRTLVEEEPLYEKKLRLGRKMAGGTDANRSPSTDSSLSSVDKHTPTELWAISHTRLFTPTPPPPPSPPPRATRRRSRLPVIAMKFGGAVKEVADGCKLQSSQTTLEGLIETLEKFEFHHHPSPGPPAAPSGIPTMAPKFPDRPKKAVPPNSKRPHRGTLAVAPKVPAPPSEAAPPYRIGLRHGTTEVTPKVPAPPSEDAPVNRKGPRHGTPAVTPKVPAPPSEAAPPNRKGPRRGFLVVAPKVPAPPSEAAPPNSIGLRHGTPAVTPKVPAPPSEAAPPNRKGPRRGFLVVAPKVPAPPSEAASPNRIGLRHGTPAVTPKVPAPPSEAVPANRKGPRHGTPAVTPKVPAPPSEAAPPNRKGPRRGTKCHPKAVADQEDLQPLVDPAKSLSLCFTQLTSDNWEKNLDGLKSVRALARHHPEVLQTNLHEVCLLLTEAVNNLRSAVAYEAMGTGAELHAHLGRAMDTEAEWTGRVLLLKLAKTTNSFLQQQANLALDALVEGCSPGRIINVLLDTGLSHRCAAVRASTAEHLHQLGDIVGEDQILTAGKIFTERFLVAVSKMAVDPAQKVRHYGQKMLKGLVHQKEFTVQWERIIPEKDRRPVEKILKKMRQ